MEASFMLQIIYQNTMRIILWSYIKSMKTAAIFIRYTINFYTRVKN